MSVTYLKCCGIVEVSRAAKLIIEGEQVFIVFDVLYKIQNGFNKELSTHYITLKKTSSKDSMIYTKIQKGTTAYVEFLPKSSAWISRDGEPKSKIVGQCSLIKIISGNNSNLLDY